MGVVSEFRVSCALTWGACRTDPGALSGPMLTAEDMPGICKSEQWARLIALRDAKISLETDTAQLNNTVQLLGDQLEVLQEEQALLEAELTAAEQVQLSSKP